MADIHKILRYLGKNCKFTTLPSYDDLKEGLEVDKSACNDVESQFIIPMKFSDRLRDRKLGEIKKIASHLWGGNEDIKRVFHKIDGFSIHELYFARTLPLRVKVFFSNDFEKTFYVKPLDEKRLFGIELENMLSPYKYEYSASGGGIYESEISGIEQEKLDSSVKKDSVYLEELARLDYRGFVMLLSDINPNVNPHNCLVSKEISGEDYSYHVRPIDFDGLFEIQDFYSELVLSGQREDAINSIGGERYYLIRGFEKESMRKRYCQHQSRLDELLEIIGSSNSCNKEVPRLAGLLNSHYRNPDFKFSKAENMGELFGMHLRAQLGDL